MERVNENDSNSTIKHRVLEALKRSHQHLTAKNLIPVYPKKKHQGQIQKESTVYFNYNRKQLANKSFIYDELVSINGNWEYSIVTLI